MATVEKDIKASGGDYTTVSSWEAASYGATSSDDAIGYGFNESYNDNATINDATPLSVKLTVKAGEEHDGTPGTGPRQIPTTGTPFVLAVDMTLEGWEASQSGTAGNNHGVSMSASNKAYIVHRMIIHDISQANNWQNVHGIYQPNFGSTSLTVTNSLVFNIDKTSGNTARGAWGIRNLKATGGSYNCTVHNITGNADMGYGIEQEGVLQNCIATDATGTTAGEDYNSGATPSTESHNLSSDATAAGTGSLTSKTASNQYVSIVGEDFKLKAGADAIDAGTDLGTTPTGVNLDCVERDRDAQGDTWDMGWNELVPAAGGGPPAGGLALLGVGV